MQAEPNNIFALCAKAFGGIDVLNGYTERGYSPEYRTADGHKLMTFEPETYLDPHDGQTYAIGLISIYGDPREKQGTIVVADQAFNPSQGQISGGDITQVLSILYNNRLVTDDQINACLKHHGE